MTSFASSTPLTGLPYPRTGKRGVPQQFPRRLYEMLESEARLSQTDPNHKDIISWSDSGNAFRILNVSSFSSHVLPKYFRTSKFSSFQRNLNLVSESPAAEQRIDCHEDRIAQSRLIFSMAFPKYAGGQIRICTPIHPS